jgi:hypothetical protein
MLKTDESQRSQNENQEELCPGDRPTHDERYPYLTEFSEFISTVSTDALKSELLTHQQRLMAESLWSAANYGGSSANCAKKLKEIYGPRWYKITSVEEHMEPVRLYYEYVLILDHKKQWDNRNKLAKLDQKETVNG